jgi:hypothetical protein
MNKYGKFFIICVIVIFFVVIGAYMEKHLIITHPAYWALFGAIFSTLIGVFFKFPK